MIAERGLAKVLDLSLARPPGPVPKGLGTRGYRPPEQESGGAVSAASDVWGIGAVLAKAAGPTRLPRSLAGAIEACLRADPGARPGVAELAARLAPHAGELPAAA